MDRPCLDIRPRQPDGGRFSRFAEEPPPRIRDPQLALALAVKALGLEGPAASAGAAPAPGQPLPAAARTFGA